MHKNEIKISEETKVLMDAINATKEQQNKIKHSLHNKTFREEVRDEVRKSYQEQNQGKQETEENETIAHYMDNK